MEQSEVAESQDKETVNEDDDEMNSMYLLADSFEIEQNVTNDIQVIDEKSIEFDVSKAAVSNDNNPESLSDAMSVKKASNTSNYNSIRLKGFSTRIVGRLRLVVNLLLMARSSKHAKSELRCEGFPIEMMENELIPLFEKFGPVYKLIKLNGSSNVSVIYVSEEDTDEALKSLNNTIVQGNKLKLLKCTVRGGQLILRKIPYTATKKDLFTKFSSLTLGLQSVVVYNDLLNENRNRGYCYLDYGEFENARYAKYVLERRNFVVDWPDQDVSFEKTADTLFVSNLHPNLQHEDLKKLFNLYGEIIYLKHNRNSAVIKFQYAEDAARAAREIDKTKLGNENIEISFDQITRLTNLNRLYISNLSANLNTVDLEKIFSRYGVVTMVHRNGDYASVRFEDSEQARRAARLIDKNQLGVNVRLSLVERKESRTEKSNEKQVEKREEKPTDKLIRKSTEKRPEEPSEMRSGQRKEKREENRPEKVDKKDSDKSSDTLYMKNLRSNITASDLRKCFTVYGEVLEIDKTEDTARVRFRIPVIAKQAARDVDKQLLGKNVQISFGLIMSDTLYIRNLYPDISASTLRQLFTIYGDVMDVEKNENCASVRFSNDEQSMRAAHEINRKYLGEANVEVSLFPKKVVKSVFWQK